MRKVRKIWEKSKTQVADGDDRRVMAQFTKHTHISTHTHTQREMETKTKTDGCKHEKSVLHEAQSEIASKQKKMKSEHFSVMFFCIGVVLPRVLEIGHAH